MSLGLSSSIAWVEGEAEGLTRHGLPLGLGLGPCLEAPTPGSPPAFRRSPWACSVSVMLRGYSMLWPWALLGWRASTFPGSFGCLALRAAPSRPLLTMSQQVLLPRAPAPGRGSYLALFSRTLRLGEAKPLVPAVIRDGDVSSPQRDAHFPTWAKGLSHCGCSRLTRPESR